MEDGAFLTIKTKKKYSQKDIEEDRHKVAIDNLAKVVYYLENRIAELEKMFFGKPSKRGIKLIEE